MTSGATSKGSAPFERFEDLARKIVSVPKKEVEKKERERLAKKNGRRKKA